MDGYLEGYLMTVAGQKKQEMTAHLQHNCAKLSVENLYLKKSNPHIVIAFFFFLFKVILFTLFVHKIHHCRIWIVLNSIKHIAVNTF